MSQFRKLPATIEAMQFRGTVVDCGVDYALAFDEWMATNAGTLARYRGDKVLIHTLEGQMTASKGDWIIKGIAGEIYPCKPDIFAKTYEPVQAPASPNTGET